MQKELPTYVLTVNTPGVTILSLKKDFPTIFYPQDWYELDKFVSVPLTVGRHVLKAGLYGSAQPDATFLVALMVARFLSSGEELWSDEYVWTCSHDDEGNRIYAGGWNRGKVHKGIQIHRHIKDPGALPLAYHVDLPGVELVL